MQAQISKELIEKTVNYLGGRPWIEVQGLLAEWFKVLAPPAPKVEEPKDEVKKD